jgi:hypothetical protein
MKYTQFEVQVGHIFEDKVTSVKTIVAKRSCKQQVTYKKVVRAHVRDRSLNHKYFQNGLAQSTAQT